MTGTTTDTVPNAAFPASADRPAALGRTVRFELQPPTGPCQAPVKGVEPGPPYRARSAGRQLERRRQHVV